MAPYTADVVVRWSDQDAYGHVNHARVVTLLEDARTGLFFDAAAHAGVSEFEVGLLVAALEVTYRRPISWSPRGVHVEMAVHDIRAASFRVAYRLLLPDGDGWDGAKPAVEGEHPARALRPRLRAPPPPHRAGAGVPRRVRVVTLSVPDADDRAALADVVGRVVRLDPAAAVRLRGAPGRVLAWAPTPFDVLVSAAVAGGLEPDDVTVMGSDLLAALSVVAARCSTRAARSTTAGAAPSRRPSSGVRWARSRPATPRRWPRRASRARAPATRPEHRRRPCSSATACEVAGVRIPMRCLLALAGMGWPANGAPLVVALSGDGAWMRLGTAGPGDGAIVRHRRPRLAWA